MLTGRQDCLHQSIPIPSPALEGLSALRIDCIGRVTHLRRATREKCAAKSVVQDKRHGISQVIDRVGGCIERTFASKAMIARTTVTKLAKAWQEACMLQVRIKHLHTQVLERTLESGVSPCPPAVKIQLKIFHCLKSWRTFQCYTHLLHLGETSPVCISIRYHCTIAVKDPCLQVHHAKFVPFTCIPQSEEHLGRILPLHGLQFLYT
mmetsp:Transcript_87071/g.186657  ORF Transcript_87071/g.186657 Transcript_87071/m.186657 type:complete len:207 (+) Transcript_87071:661-1281(+)